MLIGSDWNNSVKLFIAFANSSFTSYSAGTIKNGRIPLLRSVNIGDAVSSPAVGKRSIDWDAVTHINEIKDMVFNMFINYLLD
jgi:hypothetical protein